MADKKELRARIIKAYCAINDVLALDYSDLDPRGKDMGLAQLAMIARDAVHRVLDIIDYETDGRPSTHPLQGILYSPGDPSRVCRLTYEDEKITHKT